MLFQIANQDRKPWVWQQQGQLHTNAVLSEIVAKETMAMDT